MRWDLSLNSEGEGKGGERTGGCDSLFMCALLLYVYPYESLHSWIHIHIHIPGRRQGTILMLMRMSQGVLSEKWDLFVAVISDGDFAFPYFMFYSRCLSLRYSLPFPQGDPLQPSCEGISFIVSIISFSLTSLFSLSFLSRSRSATPSDRRRCWSMRISLTHSSWSSEEKWKESSPRLRLWEKWVRMK